MGVRYVHVHGEVVGLWRYPVKSMLGERCEQLVLDARGVLGDRLFAVRDADGKLGSGKNTRRFGRIDGLFYFQAHYRGATPYLRFPGGEIMSGDDPDVHAALSAALGRPVRLVQESDVSHLDAAAVHLLSTGSLDWLSAGQPVGGADVRRFRPNLLVAADGSQPELQWVGRRLRIGEAELKITVPTERCGMVTQAQSGLAQAPQVLRRIGNENDVVFGVYAEVVRGGCVRLGDAVVAFAGDSES